MERNSVINQRIKEKFVQREVYTNVNSMVEYILSKSYEDSEAPFSWDDIENYYATKCPQCGDTNSMEEEENEEGETVYKCSYCDHEQEEEFDTEPQEVYEWWIVSGWLCDKLKEKGEVVIESEGIWGRCTTGQAILLDSIISDICEDMGILEGQEHEWKI